MKSYYFLLLLLALVPASWADTLIIEPSEIAFFAPFAPKYPPNDFGANSLVRVTIDAQYDWSVSCIYESLTDGSGIIPGDRFFIKKQGEDFLPMTSILHIGSGTATNGTLVEVNTLEFLVHVLQTDRPGSYYGSIKFIDDTEQEMAVLPITLTIDPYMNFRVEEPGGPLVFTINGESGVYSPDNDNYIELKVDGNTELWQLGASYEGTYPSCNLMGHNHYVKCEEMEYQQDEGAGEGFMHLGYTRVVLDGDSEGITAHAPLFFKLETSCQLSPRQYNSQIKIDSQEFPQPQIVDVEINVAEYLAIEVSETQVNILSAGPPGEYQADREVKLKVASNASKWEARAVGEPLKSDDDEIPASRLFIESTAKSETGYMPLDQEQIIANGDATEMTEVSNLTIKVITEWQDKAGKYNGNIFFTVIALP